MSSEKIITVQFLLTSKTPTEASMLEICALVYILFGIYLREIIFVGLLSLKNEQDKNTIIHKKKKRK